MLPFEGPYFRLTMVRTFFVALVLLLAAERVNAQRVNLSDSLYQVLQGSTTFVLKLDTRNSFVTGRSAQIWGVKTGVSFQKRLNLGVYFSWLRSRIEVPRTNDSEAPLDRLKFFSFGVFAEYSFYRKGPWEATIPVQLGLGKTYLSDPARNRYMEGSVMVYEPAMIVEYKILKLIAVGGGIGYRLMLIENNELGKRFTSPFYMVRLRLLPEEWVRLGKKWRDDPED